MWKSRSNCILFAIRLYHRRFKRGKKGYVVIRKSHYGPFPHFMYQYKIRGNSKQVGFVPKNPKFKWIPPPLFRGKIKFGDK